MAFITNIINMAFNARRKEIDRFRNEPAQVQAEQLQYLLEQGSKTEFGRTHKLHAKLTPEEFQLLVPVREYDQLASLIDRARQGEGNLLWPGETKWFAKSSGTSDNRSKYIPVTDQALEDFHLKGPKDVMAIFSNLYPDSKIFNGKTLTLGGSRRLEREGDASITGDLSAILIEKTPLWANMWRVPTRETALIPDFDSKVKAICGEVIADNVTCFAGVPSWNLVLMNRIIDYTGAANLLEIWPNLELFVHGGVNFAPYREQFRKLIPSDQMKYMETYNASEGFFAIGDDPARDDMLLMLDYHIYYEFLAMSNLGDTSKAIPLDEVKTGVNYAMIITSSNGLWRYMIGDTVEFTSTEPYRIRITGRTRHFINTFGEEVIIDNAERALSAACVATGAIAPEYSVAPVYMDVAAKGCHQWIIEFTTPPSSIEKFTAELDRTLQSRNSDYEAKRFKDTTLLSPLITVAPEGTFARWMASKGKTGGQNKAPRLYNDRTYVEELLKIINTPQ